MPDQDIFTLPSLIRWLEKQPADQAYDYYETDKCVLCQYFGDHGFVDPVVNATRVRDATPGADRVLLPDGWDEIAEDGSHTFGAALDRARALLASQRSTDAAVERIKADALAETEGV